MQSLEIRKKFFDFFIKNGHTKVPSSSLIPAQDPTLLFANAGMNQFKDVFLGKETRSYKRAVSIQKCIRAGGKHNDLENVGFTKRHLTFFEMMGNFSFGDYFKKEAIGYAWDFLTQDMGLPAEKLYATVYKLDQESYDIWFHDIGLPAERISRLGESDNFWQMGDTGPCGPCSEIYIDRGTIFGCGSTDCAPGCSCDRFLEIWNNVFMQYDRQPDGTDKPLKQTGVDTGMGLERLCAIMQDKDSVFETDLFSNIIAQTEQLTGHAYATSAPEIQGAFRVLADHIRSSCFAIADGCTPSNEGRGYVLRKIIRRAALFAQKLSDKNFFPQLAPALIVDMGTIYPELKTQEKLIISLLTSEVEKFSQNLVHGQAILTKYREENKNTKTITGHQAFKLYDTYGFPLELTNVIAHEYGYTVDKAGFEQEMEQQRLQSGKKIRQTDTLSLDESITTEFTGYSELETTTQISAIAPSSDKKAWIITQKSPFYIECGGQISDTGWLIIKGNKFPVLAVKKIDHALAHEIQTTENLKVGDAITLQVDKESRTNTMKNHTATHLLQAALIAVLGKTIKQSGSLVTPDYLRFDFTYHENLTPEQIKQVELIVNQKITENIPVSITTTTYKDAVSRGVIAFFGEKYNPENVRVVEVPGFSAELCGGTHVTRTGDIGCFKITEVSALSAGNRRLVALTGPKSLETFQESFGLVKTLTQEYKVKPEGLLEVLNKQRELLKTTQNQVKELRKQLFALQLPAWAQLVKTVGTIPFGFIIIKNASAEELRDIAQQLVSIKPALYFLVSAPTSDRANFFVIQAPELQTHVDIKALGAWLKEQGLQGGGSANTLQGGALHIEAQFENKIKDWITIHKK